MCASIRACVHAYTNSCLLITDFSNHSVHISLQLDPDKATTFQADTKDLTSKAKVKDWTYKAKDKAALIIYVIFKY